MSPDYSNSGVSFVNNIVGSIKGKANSHIVQVGSTSETEDWHHNVYYSGTGDIDQYRIGNTTPISFSSWDGTAGIDESGSVDASSAPVDSGLNPIAGGAAHNSASSLTSVKGTGGWTVELYNANYFVVGDVVKTSGGNVATISVANCESAFCLANAVFKKSIEHGLNSLPNNPWERAKLYLAQKRKRKEGTSVHPLLSRQARFTNCLTSDPEAGK